MGQAITREPRHPLPRVPFAGERDTIWIASPGQPQAEGRIIDLSQGGLGIYLPEGAPLDLTGVSQVQVSLPGDHLQRQAALISYVRDSAPLQRQPGKRIGLSLLFDQELPLSALTFSSTDPDWDLIDRPEDLQELFADLIAYGVGQSLQLHLGRERRGARLLDHGLLKEKRQLLLSCDGGEQPFRPGDELVVTFERYGCTYLFHSKVRTCVPQELVLSLPQAAVRLLRRKTDRLSAAKVEGLTARLHHPLSDQRSDWLPLSQINEQGCLLRLPKTFPLYPVFLQRIPVTLAIAVPSGAAPSVSLFGSVRSLREDGDSHYQLGLGFAYPDEENRKRLSSELARRRHPAIDIVYRADDHAKIWRLLDESKYLEEKSRESFAPMVDITRQVWADLQRGMDQISRRILIRHGEQIMGQLQMDRAYPKAWVVHHLAIHPATSKIIAGELYTTVTDFLNGRQIPFLVSVTREDKAWNRRNYYDFVEHYPYPEHHHLRRLFLYEHDLQHLPPLQAGQHIFQNPTSFDLESIARYFEIHQPPLVCQALALSPGELTLDAQERMFNTFGLSRRRRFLLYKEGRKLLGFAMLDLATSGINVFNLFDKFEVFSMVDGDPQREEEVAGALIAAALHDYRGQGKVGVLFASESDRQALAPALGLRFVFHEVVWIANCAAAKRYQAFTQTMYGRLLAKRARLHGGE